jgi:hypothetical protein
MDTKTLIAEAKARFNHNSAKAYLKEKYNSKLLIAEQGGLWRADAQTISFLNSFTSKKVVLLDTFDNPVEVDRKALLNTLTEVNETVMKEWYNEWQELETKR